MIEISKLTKTYDRGTKALKDVNITIDDGEFVFITGRSGSGKSTLIKILLKEVEPSGTGVQASSGLRGRSFLRTGRLLAEATAHLRLPSVLYRLLSGTDLRTTVQGEDGCRFYRGVEELSEAVQAVRQ